MTDTMREAFEKWIKAPSLLIKTSTGEYALDSMNEDFSCFKAGYKAAQADARALVGELVYALQSDTGGLAAITKAQAFMEGK